MAANTFKYYLKKDASTYYTVANGNVIETGVKTPQTNNPIDWENGTISFERNLNYWGIFIQYSLPFQFVLDSAKILRQLLYEYGREAKCTIYIEKLNSTSLTYEFFYQGDLNFYKATDSRDSFTIEVLDKGASSIIKTSGGITVETPLNLAQAVTVQLDGVKFKCRSSWIMGDSSREDPIYPPIQHGTASGKSGVENVIPTYSSMNTQFGDFFFPNNAKYDEYAFNFHDLGAGVYASAISGTAKTDLSGITFSGQLRTLMVVDDTSGGATGYFFRLRCIVSSQAASGAPIGTLISDTVLATSITIAPSVWTDITFNINDAPIPNVSNTQTIAFTVETVRVGGSPGDNLLWRAYYYTEDSNISMDYYAKIDPSTTKMLGYMDVLKFIMSNISQGQNSVVSAYLSNTATDNTTRFNNWDSIPYYVKLGCGNGFRNYPNAAIKCSFDDIAKDLHSTYCVGIGVDDNNQNIIIEPIKYFFKNELIEDIKKVNNIEISPFEGKYISGINIGYDYPVTGTQNTVGKNEFNTTIQYKVQKYTGEANIEDLVSPVNASIYLIEGGRTSAETNQKADNSTDNTTFKIEVDPIPVLGKYKVLKPTSAVITGVDDPANVYNVFLNPAYNLLRRLPLERSISKRGNLLFQTIQQNPSLVSTWISGTVNETGNITLENDSYGGHDTTAIFSPDVVDFDFVPSVNTYNNIKAKPTGYVTFPFYGKTIRAYVLKVDLKPATNETHFRGLIHKDDISKLKR